MKVSVEAYGCTMSMGEGVMFQRKLASLGHDLVSSEDADLVVLSTCAVIQSTENRMLRRIRELTALGKRLVVAGCLAEFKEADIVKAAPRASVLPFSRYPEFHALVEGLLGPGGEPRETQDDGVVEVIPIAQGCLGSCAYCITRLTRGALVSRPPNEICSGAQTAIARGYRELQVTAQDTAAYGLDIGADLPTLVRSLASLNGKFRLRVGMMNPDTLFRIHESYIQAWKLPKVYKFLHLPVQTGSDGLLEAMGRQHTIDDFLLLVDGFRMTDPHMTLSTDVIVGFPGETDDDHERTKELLERVRPDIVNITRFSPRPGTIATRMPNRVSGTVAKERSRELTRLRFEIAADINRGIVGESCQALVTEKGKSGGVIARTDSYKPVVIGEQLPLGQWIQVEIVDFASTHLYGRLLSPWDKIV